MTKITINELVWDDYNKKHIEKHNVTEKEISEAGFNLIYHKRSEINNERYLAIGRSGKRLLTLVIHRIKTGKYYLITARDASRKERRAVYEKEKKQIT